MSEIDGKPLEDVGSPKWLDAKFVEKYLRNHYNNVKIRVCTLDVKSIAEGEHFSSLIFKITVRFSGMSTRENELSTQSLILKTALTDGVALESLLAHNVYDKEIEFYNKIVPQINQLLSKLNQSNKLVPEIFGICKEKSMMLIDDLYQKGYRLAPIQSGLNMAEAKAVLKELAVFHAICAVLQENQADIFANFKHGPMSRASDVFHSFYYLQFDAMIETISTWPDFNQYTEKLRQLRETLIEKGCQMFDLNLNHFNSLSHGDLWLNNIMIKTNDDNMEKSESPFENVMFIDFQDSCWTSSTLDVHYILNTSLCETLRPNSFHELVEYYREELSVTLKCLNYQKHIPNRAEYFEQFNGRQFYGFVTACLTQPFMINNSIKDGDLDKMVSGNDQGSKFRRNMYDQPKIQANLRKLIPIYDQMGLFDQF